MSITLERTLSASTIMCGPIRRRESMWSRCIWSSGSCHLRDKWCNADNPSFAESGVRALEPTKVLRLFSMNNDFLSWLDRKSTLRPTSSAQNCILLQFTYITSNHKNSCRESLFSWLLTWPLTSDLEEPEPASRYNSAARYKRSRFLSTSHGHGSLLVGTSIGNCSAITRGDTVSAAQADNISFTHRQSVSTLVNDNTAKAS